MHIGCKEWAVVVAAGDRGEQTILPHNGSSHEPRGYATGYRESRLFQVRYARFGTGPCQAGMLAGTERLPALARLPLLSRLCGWGARTEQDHPVATAGPSPLPDEAAVAAQRDQQMELHTDYALAHT